jgi:anti-sigma B factor antagonist
LFTYTIHSTKLQAILSLQGDIDIDVTEAMEETIPPALAAFEQIEIDFSKVPFVDSSGIGLLIKLVQTLQESGKQIQIKHVQTEVMEVFEILQLRDILGGSVLK